VFFEHKEGRPVAIRGEFCPPGARRDEALTKQIPIEGARRTKRADTQQRVAQADVAKEAAIWHRYFSSGKLSCIASPDGEARKIDGECVAGPEDNFPCLGVREHETIATKQEADRMAVTIRAMQTDEPNHATRRFPK
jgi:hypothetical protein